MDKKIFVFLNCICLWSYAAGLQATGSLQTITLKECGTSILPPSSPDRIVGGNTALHGQYPWMISLRYNAIHKCGAAVLNENWVITAAHCISFADKPWRYDIVVGLHKLYPKDKSTVQTIEVSKIVVHEDFQKLNYVNDIALLKTVKPINIAGSRGYVNGICLPNTDNDPTGYATVIGWGHTTFGGVKSDTLREVVLPIVPRRICNAAYDRNPHDEFDRVLSTMICAGETGKDSCQGDSGGPLFQTNSKGVSTLIGITSYGIGCGLKYYPGIYTKVSSYQSWIENIIAAY